MQEAVVAPTAETQAPVESKQQPLELDQQVEVVANVEETPAEPVVEAPVAKQPKAAAKPKQLQNKL